MRQMAFQPLVAHSPLMRWIYHFLTVRQFSDGLGVVEVAIAILIALRSWSPKASALGSALAILMFLTTLSFIFSTLGWKPSLGWFSCAFGDARAVSAKGRGLARGGHMVARRVVNLRRHARQLRVFTAPGRLSRKSIRLFDI